jgi:hypothetical protein
MKKILIKVVLICSICSCKNNEQKEWIFDDCFSIKTADPSFSFDKTQFTIDGLKINYEISWACNNYYEYDKIIVSENDTLLYLNYLKNGYDSSEIILSNLTARNIDLDYYRSNNVFFDTIDSYPCKFIEPRVFGKGKYIVLFDSLKFLKDVNANKCISFNAKIESRNDYYKFQKIIKSLKFR